MANGTDSEQFAIMTKVKKGFKREFDFALKSQSQISESKRRTRSGNGQDSGSGNAELSEWTKKRLKTEVMEVEAVREGVVSEQNLVGSPASDESMKSGIVDPASDEERKSDYFNDQELVKDGMVETPFVSPIEEDVQDGNQLEAKPLQHYVRTKFKGKVTETADGGPVNDENSNADSGRSVEKDGLSMVKLSKVPKNLKDLLETGLLEGLPVKYHRSMKAKVAGKAAELKGVIKGAGILCFCGICKGAEVVSPHVFELHAGSTNKRPPEYIFLENRKCLRDVMNACKDVPMDAIEETIRKTTGPAPQPQAAVSGSICDLQAHCSQVIPCTRNSVESFVNRSSEKAGLAEPRTKVLSGGSLSRSKPDEKITKKHLGLHKLVFEEDILPDGTEVAYVANSVKLRHGYKSGIGICCDCCNKVISPSQFEAHAGRASHRKPFHNIYISNGVSLHELSVSLIARNICSVKEKDKLCKVCRKGGGDLTSCGGCPRSFHKACAPSLSKLDGILYCRTCEGNLKEKFNNANALAAGRVPGVDSIEQIVNRSIRIINIREVEVGGCIICRDPVFTHEFGPLTVIICEQCEREYHVGCLKEKGMADLKKEPDGDWFCCQECERIHSALHKLVARGEERLPDSLLGSIKNKSKPSTESASGSSFVVKWRILSGKMASEESRPLLVTAVDLLRENFGPIVDPGTNADLIPAMVNAEEVKMQDFRGMYCAVLTVNSAVVSAGVFRIRGQELAEMPLVATSSQAHGKGYFQTLFACLERFFGFVKVQKIVLPAADGAEAIWTKKFGFSQMSEEELKPFMESYHLMNFQGLPWFKKAVPKVRIIS
ncbi:hypothetical protein QQ045_025430 [Rhodiola kirilowii]